MHATPSQYYVDTSTVPKLKMNNTEAKKCKLFNKSKTTDNEIIRHVLLASGL